MQSARYLTMPGLVADLQISTGYSKYVITQAVFRPSFLQLFGQFGRAVIQVALHAAHAPDSFIRP
jgi:hypothetical protein